MGKKKRLIDRLENEVERLRVEVARVDQQAKKRVKKAEKDAAALRDELRKFIAQVVPGVAGDDASQKSTGASSPKTVAAPPAKKAITTGASTTADKPAKSAAPTKSAASTASAPKKPAAKKTAAKKPTAKKAAAKKSAGTKTPTVAELRSTAKSKGVKGYSTMTKAQLLAALNK